MGGRKVKASTLSSSKSIFKDYDFPYTSCSKNAKHAEESVLASSYHEYNSTVSRKTVCYHV